MEASWKLLIFEHEELGKFELLNGKSGYDLPIRDPNVEAHRVQPKYCRTEEIQASWNWDAEIFLEDPRYTMSFEITTIILKYSGNILKNDWI